jgi:hypothetical protein
MDRLFALNAACYWVDLDHSLCSNYACIGATPLAEFMALAVPAVRFASAVTP